MVSFLGLSGILNNYKRPMLYQGGEGEYSLRFTLIELIFYEIFIIEGILSLLGLVSKMKTTQNSEEEKNTNSS